MNSAIERGVHGRAAPQLSTSPALAARQRPTALAHRPSPGRGLDAFDGGLAVKGASHAFLSMPFDAMRFQYASTVRAGLIERSLLASAQLERTLATLEKLILGPLARQR